MILRDDEKEETMRLHFELVQDYLNGNPCGTRASDVRASLDAIKHLVTTKPTPDERFTYQTERFDEFWEATEVEPLDFFYVLLGAGTALSYWAKELEYHRAPNNKTLDEILLARTEIRRDDWEYMAAQMVVDGSMVLTIHDGERDAKYVLNRQALVHGIETYCKSHGVTVRKFFDSGLQDAGTDDCMIQRAALGEEVYG